MTTDTLPQSALTMLPADQVELSRDQYQRLALRIAERTWDAVKPVRAFPLTAPGSCVFLLDTDGREIGFIASVAQLAAPSREALQETLSLDYLCTVVQAITSVKSRHGVSTWEVRTERGSRTVHIKDRNDIRKLPGNRVIITDVDGLRFEIPDASRLDDKSQGLLESES